MATKTKNNINDKWKKGFFYFIATVLAMFPYVITFTTEDNEIYTPMVADLPKHLEMEKGAVVFFGILLLIAFMDKFTTKDKSKRKLSIVLGIVFSVFTVFGKSFESIASWGYIFTSISGFLASICSMAGYGIIYYYSISIFINFIDNCNDIVSKNSFLSAINNYIQNFLKSKSLLKIWIVLMICWLLYIIINYPAIIHADSGVMLGEYWNNSLFNHHPVVQTVIWGSFVDFGYNVFGSYNVGVFLYALIQYLYGTFIIALILDYVYKKGYPVIMVFAVFVVFALTPAFPRYSTAVCKDSNYSLFVLFMVWLLMKTIDAKEQLYNFKVKSNILIFVGWILTILFVCFSRKNGIHLVILTSIFTLLYLRKNVKSLLIILAAVVIGSGVYFEGEYIIKNVLDIGNDDTKEIYSIPFQQTARYVRDFGAEVTSEEREAIDAVLDYNQMAGLYSPELCDPVKNTFRTESTKEDFSRYLGVWFKMFFKHPLNGIEATISNTYGYFYPENVGYYKDVFFMTQCVDENKIGPSEGLKAASEWLCNFNMKTRQMPVIGLFCSLGFFVWMDIFVMIYFILYKKDKKFVLYNIPALITLLICVASPANNTMRYGLPIMFIAPVLLCMCFKNEK